MVWKLNLGENDIWLTWVEAEVSMLIILDPYVEVQNAYSSISLANLSHSILRDLKPTIL